MFKKARVRLTIWYLLVIMAVTLGFSVFVYMGVNTATTRALETQRNRIEKQFYNYEREGHPIPPPLPHFSAETLVEIRERTLVVLGIINLFVLITSAGLGYFLAGKTLKPIENALDKQKRFISDAAHEIKTPLTAMKTDIEVTLRDNNLDLSKAKDSLKGTVDDIDRLYKITESLLTLCKAQGSRQQQNFEKFDISELIATLLKKYSKVAENKGFKINYQAQKAFVYLNKAETENLMSNLIDNSIKYNKSKKDVEILVAAVTPLVSIEIKNSGYSIDEEDVLSIFEPFYRSDPSRSKDNIEGVGLGLAIAKEIAEKNGGKLEVKNIKETSVSFLLKLPISGNSQKQILS